MLRSILLLACFSIVLARLGLKELVSMPYIKYSFNTDQEKEDYINNRHYVNCTIAGIKVASDGTIFVTVPRWRENVPATFGYLDLSNIKDPILVPFPDWNTNSLSTKDGLRSVLGFEIDKDDNIWVLDQGRVANSPAEDTSTKLVKFSRSGEKLDTIYLDVVTDHHTSFLNDLVYDKEHHYIYIADSGIPVNPDLYAYNPGIIAVDLKTKTATGYLYKHKSVMPDESIWITINGEKVNGDKTMMTGADGIALSCDGKILYFTPLTSRTLYSITTENLRSGNSHKAAESVKVLGYKISASDGLLMSARNQLYMTAIEQNAVYRVADVADDFKDFNYKYFEVIAQDDDLIWPDTLAIDKLNKYLYIVTNQLHHFFDGSMEFDLENNKTNFRIWTVDINDYSYVQGCSGDETTGSGSNPFPGWAIALVVGVSVFLGAILIEAGYKYCKDRKKRKALLTSN
jgi:sugar lactone lactonase YvrE